MGLISLGCAKNLVDAEIMLGTLLEDGIEIVNDPAGADAVIVNTCSFIDAAQEESIDAILESAQAREARDRGQTLIVSGCLSQRFRDELPGLLPEVDAFMGIDQVGRVSEIVREAMERRRLKLQSPEKPRRNMKRGGVSELARLNHRHDPARNESPVGVTETGPRGRLRRGRGSPPDSELVRAQSISQQSVTPMVEVNRRPRYVPDFATPRFRLTPSHFAFLKIAEGCNHPCSFCTIPRMRGSHRSRPLNDVVSEARALIADGVKELNLISQDSTYYGLDLRPDRSGSIASPARFNAAARALPAETPTLCALLRELDALPGKFWIRVLYTHPAHWTDELIETIAACPKVARYVDIPLQHIHDNMLERMRRETTRDYIVYLIRRIRAGVPGIAIRTTFIVGFPGETDACFQSLLDFVRETRFDRLGVFTYSREEATLAGRMSGQVPAALKKRRRDRVMAEQIKVSRSLAASKVGSVLDVLVEGEISAGELQRAKVFSWEHGLIRGDGSRPKRPEGRFLAARSQADAPDIDGRVYVRGVLPLSDFARVRIRGHTDYDLIGEPV